MEKKFIIILILAIMLIVTILIVSKIILSVSDNKKSYKETTTIKIVNDIYINGNRLPSAVAVLHTKNEEVNAVVPLISILRGLGYQIEHTNEDVVLISSADRIFTLNLQEFTLTENGNSGMDVLFYPPGNRYCYRQKTSDDLYVDTTSLVVALDLMGNPVYVEIDYDYAIIRLIKKI